LGCGSFDHTIEECNSHIIEEELDIIETSNFPWDQTFDNEWPDWEDPMWADGFDTLPNGITSPLPNIGFELEEKSQSPHLEEKDDTILSLTLFKPMKPFSASLPVDDNIIVVPFQFDEKFSKTFHNVFDNSKSNWKLISNSKLGHTKWHQIQNVKAILKSLVIRQSLKGVIYVPDLTKLELKNASVIDGYDLWYEGISYPMNYFFGRTYYRRVFEFHNYVALQLVEEPILTKFRESGMPRTLFDTILLKLVKSKTVTIVKGALSGAIGLIAFRTMVAKENDMWARQYIKTETHAIVTEALTLLEFTPFNEEIVEIGVKRESSEVIIETSNMPQIIKACVIVLLICLGYSYASSGFVRTVLVAIPPLAAFSGVLALACLLIFVGFCLFWLWNFKMVKYANEWVEDDAYLVPIGRSIPYVPTNLQSNKPIKNDKNFVILTDTAKDTFRRVTVINALFSYAKSSFSLHMNSIWNIKYALLQRQARKYREIDAETMIAFKTYFRQVIIPMLPVIKKIMTFENWIDTRHHWSPNKKTNARKEQIRMDEDGYTNDIFTTRTAFVKKELVNKNERKPPRLVTMPSQTITNLLGPIVSTMQKAVKLIFNARHKFVYTSGMTREQIGATVNDFLKSHGSVHYYWNDYEKYDSSICPELLELLGEAYDYMLSNCADAKSKMQLHVAGNAGWWTYKISDRVTNEVFKCKIKGTRRSGDVDTTFGNTILNMALNGFAISRNATPINNYRVLTCGDDSFLMVSQDKGPANVLNMDAADDSIRKLGIGPAFQGTNKIYEGDYCSSIFIRQDGKVRCVPKIGRILTKTPLTYRTLETKRDIVKLKIDKLRALIDNTQFVPVLCQVYRRKLQQLLKSKINYRKSKLVSNKSWLQFDGESQYHTISEDFLARYDLSLGDIIQYSEYLESLNGITCIDHDVLKCFMTKDVVMYEPDFNVGLDLEFSELDVSAF
jgi:hypothetical protein